MSIGCVIATEAGAVLTLTTVINLPNNRHQPNRNLPVQMHSSCLLIVNQRCAAPCVHVQREPHQL